MKFKIAENEYIAQRIFCIGQNYSEHIKEMKSDIPTSPVIFSKPPTSLVAPGEAVEFPKHGNLLHHEVEIVVLIGKEGKAESVSDAKSYIAGISIGLDLTMRDVQKELRGKGRPWEISKAFDKSAPIGDFVPLDKTPDLNNIGFSCSVNDDIRQAASSKDMIFSIETLIVEISKIWKLLPGDLIYTGTPSGVGPLEIGDKITINSDLIGSFSWEIVE
ncbi:MAG: fumarylacetoacetate hydrolase family protein [candidate division Zixibacteria bacterium]|nr:fumarylacetoacetate hydrolase family protein [candidate division Zixibacteria bacterium]